jgi:hypothetical protein
MIGATVSLRDGSDTQGRDREPEQSIPPPRREGWRSQPQSVFLLVTG